MLAARIRLQRLVRFAAVAVVASASTNLGLVAGAAAQPPDTADIGAYTANGPVWAIAEAGGNTYIGGDFTRVGVRSGSGALVSPSSGARQTFPQVAGGDIRAVVSDQDGGWYIGGSFTAVGGQPHVGLAHINKDGTVDSGFSPAATDFAGNPAAVDALAYSKSSNPSDPWPDDGTLYVGGEFSKVGLGAGQSHQHLAALSGSDGRPVTQFGPATGCAPQPSCSAAVRTLTVAHVPLTVGSGTQQVPVVLAGGDFTLAGPTDAASTVSGLGAFWGVGALDSTGSSISGSLVTAGSANVPWAPLSAGTVGQAVAISPANGATFAVYAAGYNASGPVLEAHQFKIGTPTSRFVANTGTVFSNWTPTPRGCGSAGCAPSVDALALGGSTLYFAGDFSQVNGASGPTANRLAMIPAVPDPTKTSGGTTATAAPFGGADGLVRGVALSSDGSQLYLAGDFPQGLAALDTATQAVTAWAPEPDASAETIATDPSAAAVYVGGRFSSLGSLPRLGLAAVNSARGLLDWAPAVASKSSSHPLVRALAASDGTLYVGGQFDQVGGSDHLNLAAVNASDGTPIDGFKPDASRSTADKAEVLSLSLLGSTLYVGGRFDAISAVQRRNLAAVDAGTGAVSGWDPEPDDIVHAILPACGEVYIGGGFASAGHQPRNYIAAIDPATGLASPWDPNADGAVLSLARFGPTIYAGGNFATIGGQLRQKAAGLSVADGTATGFDPGADGPVRALAASNAALYAGGTFQSIGGAAHSYLAALDPGTGQALGWDPEPDGSVLALGLANDALYAGGGFDDVRTTPQRAFAPFSGGAGSPFVPTSCNLPAGPPVSGATQASRSLAGASPPLTSACQASTPVRITQLAVSPRRLRVSAAQIRRNRARLTVRFVLSRCAKVRLGFERLISVRCPERRGRPARAGRCARYVRVNDVIGRGKRGVNRLSFTGGRIGRRRMAPGRYRLSITSLPLRPGARIARAYFRVVRR